MSGAAMIPDSPARGGLRPAIRGGIIAAGRGLAFCGLLLAGFGLLLVPLLAPFLIVLGTGLVFSGNATEHHQRLPFGILVILVGLGIGRLLIPAGLLAMRPAGHPDQAAGRRVVRAGPLDARTGRAG